MVTRTRRRLLFAVPPNQRATRGFSARPAHLARRGSPFGCGLRSRCGTTAVEVTAAVVVLGAIVSTAAWLTPTQVRAIVRSHDEDVALRAATACVEVLRRAPGAQGTRPVELPGVRPADLPGARGTATVERAGDGLLRVSVAVTWRAPDGDARVAAETLVATEDER